MGKGGHDYQKWFKSPIGKNWLSPINWKDGTAHIRYTVLERPKSCQIGLYTYWRSRSKHGRVSCNCGIPAAGNTTTKSSNTRLSWSSHSADYENMANEYRLQVRAGKSIQFKSKSERMEFYPLVIRATIVFVSSGDTFSGWESYPQEGGSSTISPIKYDNHNSAKPLIGITGSTFNVLGRAKFNPLSQNRYPSLSIAFESSDLPTPGGEK